MNKPTNFPHFAAIRHLVCKFIAPRKLIRIKQIELRKLHDYNGLLAQENFELWAELSRLNSPLSAVRDSRMDAEFEKAMLINHQSKDAWTCLLCGRSKFSRPGQPHRCKSGIRKRFKKEAKRLGLENAFVPTANNPAQEGESLS